MTSLVFRGRVFTGAKVVETGVRVDDGLITAVGDGDLGPAERQIDLSPDQVLAPAGVELLAAMRDWAEAPRDTIEACTRAALASGVTFVCDQANTVPRLNTPELVERRSRAIAESSYVDFGVGAHPPRDRRRLADYPGAGAFCLQIFPWDMRAWNQSYDMDVDPENFRRYAESGLTATIFADDMAMRDLFSDISEGFGLKGVLRRLDPSHHVRLMITLPSSVETILEARERLPNALIQVSLWTVLMSREAATQRIGSAAFHTPPLRSIEDVARMRALAEDGLIDVVVSHHTPHRLTDKYSSDPVPGEYTPKAGFSTMDYTYPLLVTRFGFAAACRMYCETPARQVGLNKGVIAKGYEADLVIFDTDPGRSVENIHVSGRLAEDVWRIDPTRFQSLGKVTPFIGERLSHRVAKTFLRGEEAYDAASGVFSRPAVRQARL